VACIAMHARHNVCECRICETDRIDVATVRATAPHQWRAWRPHFVWNLERNSMSNKKNETDQTLAEILLAHGLPAAPELVGEWLHYIDLTKIRAFFRADGVLVRQALRDHWGSKPPFEQHTLVLEFAMRQLKMLPRAPENDDDAAD
jgi:hypothetical protein